MENIKILFIGTNPYEFEGMVKVCKELGIEPYPSEEEARKFILSAAVQALKAEDDREAYLPKMVILSRINHYLDEAACNKLSYDKILCVFDYQFDSFSLKNNSIRFHEKYFGTNPVIFIHPTVHEPEVETIMEYCKDHENRYFLPNTKSLYTELEELLAAFSKGKTLNTVA